MLREHGEPMTLFGEGPADRRDRLRELIAEMGDDIVRLQPGGNANEIAKKEDEEVGGPVKGCHLVLTNNPF